MIRRFHIILINQNTFSEPYINLHKLLLYKKVQKIMLWVKKFVVAMSGDIWTYVGLGIAYFTLDGSAKVVTGYLIIGGLVIWLVTLPIRDNDD